MCKQDNLMFADGEKVCGCSSDMSVILSLSSEVGSSWAVGNWNLPSSVA